MSRDTFPTWIFTLGPYGQLGAVLKKIGSIMSNFWSRFFMFSWAKKIKNLNLFFARENMKKLPSKVAHNRPKSNFFSVLRRAAHMAENWFFKLEFELWHPLFFLLCGTNLGIRIQMWLQRGFRTHCCGLPYFAEQTFNLKRLFSFPKSAVATWFTLMHCPNDRGNLMKFIFVMASGNFI